MLFGVFLTLGGVSLAQLAPPNEAGVAMGHLHLNVSDVGASKNFWTALGGVESPRRGLFERIDFPGVVVLLREMPPTGGSAGTVVDHVGFEVKNRGEFLANWKNAGFGVAAGPYPQMTFLLSPDGLRVEILENLSLSVPVSFHHIHFFVTEDSLLDMQAWYVKMFGAKPGKRGRLEAADIPGANLTFLRSPGNLFQQGSVHVPEVGTKGRVLDHIGFEVKDLEAFCRKLEALGIKFDMPYNVRPSGLKTAFLTDPWGTYIELNESPVP
jgi:extradiol dioxygenase family protein